MSFHNNRYLLKKCGTRKDIIPLHCVPLKGLEINSRSLSLSLSLAIHVCVPFFTCCCSHVVLHTYSMRFLLDVGCLCLCLFAAYLFHVLFMFFLLFIRQHMHLNTIFATPLWMYHEVLKSWWVRSLARCCHWRTCSMEKGTCWIWYFHLTSKACHGADAKKRVK